MDATADLVLSPIGYPRSRRFSIDHTTPIIAWEQILRELDLGAVAAAYPRLVSVALALYPTNGTFRRLAQRFGPHPAEQDEMGGDQHLPATPPASPPTVRTDHASDRTVRQHVDRPVQAHPTPFQLPRDIGDFTGREGPLRKLHDLFQEESETTRTVVVTAIAGKGGVGKTTLAVRYAHLLQERFPDGQLYVNLRGVEADRLEPTDVLAEFLGALGVRGSEIPTGLETQARLYRSLVAHRRVLIILDNVADEAQVRPLLPGSPTCAVIITGRSRLAALESVHVLALDIMEPDEALELLTKILGAQRIAAEPAAALAIVQLCGYLPLAVRIAGARVAARSSWQLNKLVARLVDERRRLDELRVGDLEVRASFGLSYRNLDSRHQRAFRLLGMLRLPDFTALAGSLLFGVELPVAEEILEHLFDTCLLEVVGDDQTGQTRYGFHDLLRVFARECLARDEGRAARDEAFDRLLAGYVAVAERGSATLPAQAAAPIVRAAAMEPFVSAAELAAIIDREPLAWFGAERVNLVALVEHAHEMGRFAQTVRLANALTDFFDVRSHWTDWEHTHELALTSARQAKDRVGEASLLRSLGRLHRYRQPFEAISYLHKSLPLLRELNDRKGEASALLDLGLISREQGRLDEARQHYLSCLAIYEELGDLPGEGTALRSLGFVYRDLGRFHEAVSTYRRCLAVFRVLDDTRWEAYSLRGLALVHRGLGQVSDVTACYDQALPLFHGVGDRRGEAYVWYDLGSFLTEQGHPDKALTYFDRCLPVMRELRDRRGEAYAIMELGLAYRRLGRRSDANACYERCLTMLRDLGDVRGEAWGLLYLGDLYQDEDRVDDALDLYQQCRVIFRDRSDSVGEARALASLGTTLAAGGQQEQARHALADSLARFEAMDMPEAARVRTRLGALA